MTTPPRTLHPAAPTLLMLALLWSAPAATAVEAPDAATAEGATLVAAREPEPLALQRMATLIQRFSTDRDSLLHVQDIEHGPRRAELLRGFLRGWQQRAAAVDESDLRLEDRIDLVLFERSLQRQLRELDFQRQRFAEAAPLLPDVEKLLQLLEARRALQPAPGRASAEALERSREALLTLSRRIAERDPALLEQPAAVALRAAGIVSAVRRQLKEWHGHHSGYDPDFSWWTAEPYAALDQQLDRTQADLRDTLARAGNAETIVGDPIGREALLAGLADEMIPYTPEELIDIAERELAWCHAQMTIAAREMGHDNWHDALEAVKQRHVDPGHQPALVVALAQEAIDYVVGHDLVSVPQLARQDWRMNMLGAEAQLTAPFFLGGRDVWVAFPTDAMPHDKKLMSLRGNNRHFSRAVVHHELIPGHHLQHFYNSRYQTHRQLFRTPFWGEGWALYWEFLLYERGFAATPEDRLGMLFWRAHRAARIQFSLGFHLGGMTPQQAIALLIENGHEPENAAAEVRRSFAGDYSPLYQAAYMLGGLQFRALYRELVEEGDLSPRAFHDAVLKGGSMPVEMVRARLMGQAPDRGHRASWRFDDG